MYCYRPRSLRFGQAAVMAILFTLLFSPLAQAQNVAALIAQGDSLLDAGKNAKALDVYELALKKEKSPRTLVARASAFHRMKRMDRALADVKQALKIDSSYAGAHYQWALIAMDTGMQEDVEYHSSKAIANGRDSLTVGRALIVRGLSRDAALRTAPAIADLKRGTRLVADDTEGRRALARLYDAAGQPAEALAVLERLCELEPGDMGHWTNKAFVLSQLERYGEAMTSVQQALLMDKDEPVALANRSYIHMKLGSDKEAFTDIERSLRSLPGNPYALRTRALLWLRKGDRSKACDDLTLAKALGQIPEVDQLVKEYCSSVPAKERR